MDYQQAWTFLDNLQFFKIKLGLAAMRTFLGRLDHPERGLPCVHIAGTNGKGSVGATLLSCLDGAGYRVGFYTSPHLSSVRERFRIGDTFIGREEFAALATEIAEVLGGEQITYFEFTTTLALLWFARQGVDLAIMEVGMGGRLDATNVVQPLVSLITNVSMDHEQYLGDTLEAVAREKAGIIKQAPVVCGSREPEVVPVVESTCRQRSAPLFRIDRDFTGIRHRDGLWSYHGIDRDLDVLPLAMRGDYQVDNAALALACLELLARQGFECTPDQLRDGLARTRWPGRLEEVYLDRTGQPVSAKDQHTTRYLLDGAHNPAGVQALKRSLENEFAYNRLLLVWGAMADKDISATLNTIAPLADRIWFTRPESERSATPDQLAAALDREISAAVELNDSVSSTLEMARQNAKTDDLICVAGSLYLVGRARQILLGELVP